MSLHTQFLVPAPASTKIRLSMLSLATADALGGPAEFHPRFSFPLITSMIPNAYFGLPAGVWTDDTSMALCLARSLATCGAPPSARGFDEAHQLDTYVGWWKHGYLSATGACFDIGGTTQRALAIWANRHSSLAADPPAHRNELALGRIGAALGGAHCCGNGSLMRVLPVGLAYWRDEAAARAYAWRSSAVTHPHALCGEACALWARLIARTMAEAGAGGRSFTKLALLAEIAAFAYTQPQLRDALALPSSAPPPPAGAGAELEQFYRTHHPLLVLISQAPAGSPSPFLSTPVPPAESVPSSGYVLHTLTAALYAFFATRTFEEGAIMVVNMGDDADTVGAVYGGLAGCWYGGERGLDGGLFWTEKVEEWVGALVKRELVENVAEELVRFSESLGDS